MPFEILNTDLFDFDLLASLEPNGMPATGAAPDTMSLHHPKAGLIRFESNVSPHLNVLHVDWDTKQDLIMRDNTVSDTVNINFQLSGYMHTCVKGTGHKLHMACNRHNLLYSPVAGDIHHIAGGHAMSLLHISLEKEFFMLAIGCHDAWSAQVLNNIQQNRPFAGAAQERPVSHKMRLLINSIRNCTETGAMRNLLIQSRVLELLALEIEQFREQPQDNTVKKDDAEKLANLKIYIDTHYLEDLSLHQLSRISLLNEFKLKKGFKQLYGTTIFTYIHKLRMEHAALLLKSGKTPVEEVAMTVGYEYAHHFAAAFKKHFSVSPTQYRKSPL